MQTKWMMSASAAAMGALGLAATFLPQEIAARAGVAAISPAILMIQVTGALYLGFAMLNWSVRDMVIGGIYNRPIALGNFLHFTVAGLALARAVAGGARGPVPVALACGYALFALWFGRALFHSPARSQAA